VALDTSSSAAPSPAAPAASSEAASASASGASSGAASSGPAGLSDASASASPTSSDSPQLVLEVDGLGVAVGASIRHLPFGTPRSAVSAALTATLGELRVSRLTECGQGARTQLDRQGFSVLLQGTRFVGWTDAGSAGRHLTTADGVGVGSTLGQVRAQYPGVSVTTGTLGPEFSSPRGLSGLTTAASSAGKVTTIYAGESCFFR